MRRQQLTQNHTPFTRRKVAHRRPVRLMSQKKILVRKELMKTPRLNTGKGVIYLLFIQPRLT